MCVCKLQVEIPTRSRFIIWMDDTSEAGGNADTVLIWKAVLSIKFQACSNLGWYKFSESLKFEKGKSWNTKKLQIETKSVNKCLRVSKSCYLCKWSANRGVEIEGVCHLLYLCKNILHIVLGYCLWHLIKGIYLKCIYFQILRLFG